MENCTYPVVIYTAGRRSVLQICRPRVGVSRLSLIYIPRLLADAFRSLFGTRMNSHGASPCSVVHMAPILVPRFRGPVMAV